MATYPVCIFSLIVGRQPNIVVNPPTGHGECELESVGRLGPVSLIKIEVSYGLSQSTRRTHVFLKLFCDLKKRRLALRECQPCLLGRLVIEVEDLGV